MCDDCDAKFADMTRALEGMQETLADMLTTVAESTKRLALVIEGINVIGEQNNAMHSAVQDTVKSFQGQSPLALMKGLMGRG